LDYFQNYRDIIPDFEDFLGGTFAPSVSNAVRLYPHYVDSWGFFIARIRKRDPTFPLKMNLPATEAAGY